MRAPLAGTVSFAGRVPGGRRRHRARRDDRDSERLGDADATRLGVGPRRGRARRGRCGGRTRGQWRPVVGRGASARRRAQGRSVHRPALAHGAPGPGSRADAVDAAGQSGGAARRRGCLGRCGARVRLGRGCRRRRRPGRPQRTRRRRRPRVRLRTGRWAWDLRQPRWSRARAWRPACRSRGSRRSQLGAAARSAGARRLFSAVAAGPDAAPASQGANVGGMVQWALTQASRGLRTGGKVLAGVLLALGALWPLWRRERRGKTAVSFQSDPSEMLLRQ